MREFSHHFTLGADLVVFGWLSWTVAPSSAKVHPESFGLRQWGPFLLVVVGCSMVMLDVLRHLLLDHGGVFFRPEQLAMYDSNGGLSAVGHATQVLTVLGVCLLMSGMMTHMGIPGKIYARVVG